MGSTRPTALDFAHHINAKSKARHPSPLKDLIRLMGVDGMITLAGGLPHPSLFPLQKVTFTCPTPDAQEGVTTDITVSNENEVPLGQWLQYSDAAGNKLLRKWCYDFTQRIHQPAFADFEILCTMGNTNAWAKVVGLLLEDDDYILCEEFTYPSSQAYWIPLGNHAAPIPLDAEGMRADLLEDRLANWESTHPGKRRPHVLYVVPVGSNPSGITYSVERKKALYEVCVKYDIVIVEDDPYYFLQFPSASTTGEAKYEVTDNEVFLNQLSPSFLRFDYQGRVIRLESFSKTLMPGLRLGYFIANPLFTDRLLRASEVETQDPAGLSQAFVLSLLQNWGQDGFLRWLQHIRIQYQTRCAWIVGAFAKHFKLVPAEECAAALWPGAQGFVAVLGDGAERVPVFNFVPPTGGMFIWAKFNLKSNPDFKKLLTQGNSLDPEHTFQNQVWRKLTDELVLINPGSYFQPWEGREKTTTKSRGAEENVIHFRLSFAMTTREDMERGIDRFSKVIRKSWGF